MNAPKGGDIDQQSSVNPLETAVDNLPVRVITHKGLTVEGYSRAAVHS